MANKEVKAIANWQSLIRQFFENNRELILSECGYDNLVEPFEKIVVDKKMEKQVIWNFVQMREKGLFGDISYNKLAAAMLAIFELDLTEVSLCSKLKHV